MAEQRAFDAAVERGVPADMLAYFRDVRRGIKGNDFPPDKQASWKKAMGENYMFLLTEPLYFNPAKPDILPIQPNFTEPQRYLTIFRNLVSKVDNAPVKVQPNQSIQSLAQSLSQVTTDPINVCYLRALLAKDHTAITHKQVLKRSPQQILSILTTGYLSPYYDPAKYSFTSFSQVKLNRRNLEFKTNNPQHLATYQFFSTPQGYVQYEQLLRQRGR